tara:strand:+ start:305 stop:433 length:129 start_codon:yes stop_codon:yes gene_type:complete
MIKLTGIAVGSKCADVNAQHEIAIHMKNSAGGETVWPTQADG